MADLPTAPPIVADPIYTTADAAKLACVKPDTMKEWVAKGIVPAVRIGTGPRAPLRIRASAIEAILVPHVPRDVRRALAAEQAEQAEQAEAVQ